MNKQTPLKNLRPILDFEDDCMISRTGSYTVAFELELAPVFTQSDSDYEKAADKFNQLFKLVPDYTIIHKMDVFTDDMFRPLPMENEDLLYRGYKEKFNERLKVVHKSYLFLSKGDKKMRGKTSAASSIFKKNIVPKAFTDREGKEDFLSSAARVETLFNDSGLFKVKRLDEEEFKKIASKYENLSFLDDAPKFTSDIFQNKDITKIGQNYLSSVSVNSLECLPKEFPDYFINPSYESLRSSLKFSLFYPIGVDFGGNHIVNQVWVVESKEEVNRDLKKMDNMNSMFQIGDKGNILNIEDNSGFMEFLENGHKAVRYHANILLWDRSAEKLTEKENLAISAFNKIDLTPNISFNEVLSLYWACYPGNAYELGFKDQSFLLLDRQSVALNVYETTRTDDISDFGLYLSDRSTTCPVYVDISDLPMKKGLTNNRNKMIFGPSGSGKSVYSNVMVNNYIKKNTDVVIVDVGDSYQRLCKLNKGKYLKYEEDNPISFNPFMIPKGEFTTEKRETLLTLIFTIWKADEQRNMDEYAIVSESLSQFYALELDPDTICFDLYYEFMVNDYLPSLKDTPADGLFNVNSFSTVLKLFYKDNEYGYLLNSFVNTGFLSEPLIVFELDNIKDHPILFPIVTLMVMDTFIAKMRLRKGRRKVILIEEAWKAISKAGMAEFLKYLYKTVRKHFGEAILVTQEVDDVVGNEIIKDAVIKNCGAKILLDMREYANDFDKIQDMLSLDKTARELVLSLNMNNDPREYYKEVFIGLGNEGAVYGVNISAEEYACYTTEKSEKEIIDEYEKKHGLEMAIKLYAEDLKLKWAS